MSYLWEIPDIEGIMYLGRGGSHDTDHTVVDGDGSRHQRKQALLDLRHVVTFLEETT